MLLELLLKVFFIDDAQIFVHIEGALVELEWVVVVKGLLDELAEVFPSEVLRHQLDVHVVTHAQIVESTIGTAWSGPTSTFLATITSPTLLVCLIFITVTLFLLLSCFLIVLLLQLLCHSL